MKLININIEGDRHLDTVMPFLRKESPDVFCLQEVFGADAPMLSFDHYNYFFLPMAYRQKKDAMSEWGILMGVKNDISCTSHDEYYYHAQSEELREFNEDDKDSTVKQGVILCSVMHEAVSYTIGTTHFTWTPHGSIATETQQKDLENLFLYLNQKESHVMIGDFNIPRHHNPLYEELVTHYTDCIPNTYVTSLDRTLHRNGNNPETSILFTDYMVDYLLTQPPFIAHNVRLEFGISDHAAVVATLEKVE